MDAYLAFWLGIVTGIFLTTVAFVIGAFWGG